MIVLKNPDNGGNIDDIFRNSAGVSKNYIFKMGETLGFDDEAGKFLLEKYAFLEEVKVEETKPTGGMFKCSECDYKSEFKVAVVAHMRKHKNEGQEPKVEVETSTSDVNSAIKMADAKQVMSAIQTRDYKRALENGDELPSTGGDGKDKDGVGWYGKGLEDDNIGNSAGNF